MAFFVTHSRKTNSPRRRRVSLFLVGNSTTANSRKRHPAGCKRRIHKLHTWAGSSRVNILDSHSKDFGSTNTDSYIGSSSNLDTDSCCTDIADIRS